MTGRRPSGRADIRRHAGFAALSAVCLGLLCLPAGSSAGYVNYPDFHRTGGLALNGSAQVTDEALRLTDGGSQAGSVFTEPTVIDAGGSIRTSFRFSQHTGSGNPGDGFTFTIQRDERGDAALGGTGGSMGYGGANEITDSVAVEFDLYGDDFIFPLNEDHVAILHNGNVTNHLAPVQADIYGGERHAWVDYSAKKKRLKVYVSGTSTKPASPTTSAKVNLKGTLGGSARAGFTGATGGESAVQDILDWRVAN